MSDERMNLKHRSILDAARALFWKHGFRRVTVEEICREAGVSKMTFYRHFGNKIDLAKEVYHREAVKGVEQFRQIMSDEATTTRQKMEAMLRMKMEGTNEISKEFLNDFYQSPELGLSAYVEEISEQIWKEIVGDFRTAQEKGWLRDDFKPEAFLLMSYKLLELINDDRMLQMYDSPQDLVMELSRLFTYGIVPYSK
jgi:AcrR family transcriptional regulator